MNAWVKGGIIFVVGAIAGAGGMYLALNRKYEEMFDEQIQDVRETYRNKILDKIEKSKEDISEKDEPETVKSTHISSEDYNSVANSENNFVDYTGFSKKRESVNTPINDMKNELDRVSRAVHDNDFDEHMADRENPEDEEDDEYLEGLIENQKIQDEMDQAKNENVKPYPIRRSEYLNQKSWHEKLSWNFYQDDIVTDDRDEIVHCPEEALGENLLEAFGLDGDDPDVAYIRDDRKAIDYEVCRISEKYYKDSIKLSTEE